MKTAVTSDSSAEDYTWDAGAGLEFLLVNNDIPLAQQRSGNTGSLSIRKLGHTYSK